MSAAHTDIDFDFADRDAALATLWHVPASLERDGERARHPTGVYFQDIPVDPLDGWAALTYKQAPEHGYFKLDFLNASLYAGVQDPAHLDRLLARDLLWEALDDPLIVSQLSQIGAHFDVVQAIRPRSVADLALVLALIRPGRRRLLGRPRALIEAEVWQPQPGDKYAYKKSHATAYALSVVVQLNLLCEQAEMGSCSATSS